MNDFKKSTLDLLKSHKVCVVGYKWFENNDFQNLTETIKAIKKPSWLFWCASRMNIPDIEIQLVILDFCRDIILPLLTDITKQKASDFLTNTINVIHKNITKKEYYKKCCRRHKFVYKWDDTNQADRAMFIFYNSFFSLYRILSAGVICNKFHISTLFYYLEHAVIAAERIDKETSDEIAKVLRDFILDHISKETTNTASS